MKEFFRKQLVALKRKPQKIAMVFIVISCLIFTFQLSTHSKAILYVASKLIALTTFVVTLSSFMSIIAFIGIKKLNKKALVPIIIVVCLLVLQIALNAYYLSVMHYETAVKDNPVPLTDYIRSSIAGIWAHIVFLSLSIAVIACLPLLAKLLAKIDTRPKAEKLGLMGTLDEQPIELDIDETEKVAPPVLQPVKQGKRKKPIRN